VSLFRHLLFLLLLLLPVLCRSDSKRHLSSASPQVFAAVGAGQQALLISGFFGVVEGLMLIFPSLLGGKDWSSELNDWRSLYDGLLHAYHSRLDGRLPTKSQCWSNESCHRISYDDLSRSQYVSLTQSLMF
jgi:hypothetical protein